MKNILKNIGLIGFFILFFLVLLLIIKFFYIGYVKVVEFVLPFMTKVSAWSFYIFIIFVLPLSIFKKIRPFVGVVSSFVGAFLLTVCSLATSLLFLDSGFWLWILCLALIPLIPVIFIIKELINCDWMAAAGLSFYFFFGIGLLFFGKWINSAKS